MDADNRIYQVYINISTRHARRIDDFRILRKQNVLHATVYFLTFFKLLFVSHFTQVLECFDM